MMKKFIYICLAFVFAGDGNFVPQYACAIDEVVDKSSTGLRASFAQAENRSHTNALADVDNDDDLLSFDLTQDDPHLVHLAGLDILAESEKFSQSINDLSNEELLVGNIQV